jgi:hypothetical protein
MHLHFVVRIKSIKNITGSPLQIKFCLIILSLQISGFAVF